MKAILAVVFCGPLLVSGATRIGAAGPVHGDSAPPPPDPSPGIQKAWPFALNRVRLLDGYFKEAMMRDRAYLLRLRPERLLHCFRVNAGIESAARPYGGWEEPKCELRGHSLGHYLSACSLMYAATGEEEFKTRVADVVSGLAECQAASAGRGFNKGYLSAFPESFIDRVETGQKVWAPWYTLHKIYAGLLDAYELCDNKQALQVLINAVGWVKFRVEQIPVEQMQRSLDTEFGGMNEVLANLYAVTRDPEHLRLAQAFNHRKVLDPLARGEDRLNGLHANTQIPKLIGAARQYEVSGDAALRRAAECFWDRVALHRSYVIGGHSDREHFFPVTDFARHLSAETAETCNTYNLLKLTRHLFGWEPAARTMDFYERALYNHILASQEPRQGMFAYFMSLEPGHFKSYSLPEDSFWCCVGTGMENHAKYGDTIYFHGPESLYVNLFIASELAWKEIGVTVRQTTSFPESETVRLKLGCQRSRRFALNVRYPSWAGPGARLTLNGRSLPADGAPGSYISVTRDWNHGDEITAKFSMSLRAECLPGDPSHAALLYGPLVLAARLGTNDMPDPFVRRQTDLVKLPPRPVPALACNLEQLPRAVEPVPGKTLSFRTRGIGRPEDLTLIPFHQTHHERYSVYFQIVAPTEASRP